MACKYKDLETGWCKLHSDWSYPMPYIENCSDSPCPDEIVEKDIKTLSKTAKYCNKAKKEFIDLNYTEEQAEQLAGAAVVFVSISEPQITVEDSVSILKSAIDTFISDKKQIQCEISKITK